MNRQKTEIVALLDTGFDGEILIPWKTYKELNLEESRLPDIFSQRGITVSGEKKKLLSSHAKVDLENLTFYPIVQTFQNNEYSLMGRGFMREFIIILNGLKKLLTIKESQQP